MTLVEIRCRKCRRVLATIGDKVPHDLSGTLTIPACPKHSTHSRYRRGKLHHLLRQGHKPVVTVGRTIEAAEIRPHVEAARAAGKTRVVTV